MMGLRAWKIVKNILRLIVILLSFGYLAFIVACIQEICTKHWVIQAIYYTGSVCVLAATVFAVVSFVLLIVKKETGEIDWFIFAGNLFGTAALLLSTENWLFFIFGVSISLFTLLINSDFEKIF